MKFLSQFVLMCIVCCSIAQAQILDDVHYYVTDRKATNAFFEKHFGAKQMADQPMNPLAFINFLQINPHQTTINVSPQGPFAGIRVGDPKRWEKTLVKPSPTNTEQTFGAHWLCFSTKNLEKSLTKLQKNGVEVAEVKITLPLEPNAKVKAVWTPDYNLLLLVERQKQKASTEFAIDHLQFLVADVAKTTKFYEDILNAKIIAKDAHSAKIEVGKHTFVLSEPEGLGLERTTVIQKDPKKFYPGIDHIGFLYRNLEEVEGVFKKSVALNHLALMKPTRMMYFDKPTPYTFCIIFNPDNYQVEMEIEEGGRYGPRTKYVEK